MRHSVRSVAYSTQAGGTADASAAVATSPIAARRIVCVKLLDQKELVIEIDSKTRVLDVYNQVAAHLHLREKEYFGLAQVIEDEYHFLEPKAKLQKLNTKAWRAGRSDRHQSESNDPFMTLYFRVQFYVDHVQLLRERLTRHMYYLQLKENLVNFNHSCNEEQLFPLAACALQAELGNYKQPNQDQPARNYFDPREYLPAWVVTKHSVPYIVQSMPTLHKDYHGMTRMDAQRLFIHRILDLPVEHNLQFYRLKKRKSDMVSSAWLGVAPKGVQIYEESDGLKSLTSTFKWGDIVKLNILKKTFEIKLKGAPGRKFTYYTGSNQRSQYLLNICSETHKFQAGTVMPRIAEIRTLDEQDRKHFHEANVDKALERQRSSSSLYAQRHSWRHRSSSRQTREGRTSVISNTSSNTTSGIASDQMQHSFEDSEGDEKGREIIIDTPPSANATPSVRKISNLSPIAKALFFNGQRPVPVDTVIQRLSMAPTMTVTSTPVFRRPSANSAAEYSPFTQPVSLQQQLHQQQLHQQVLQHQLLSLHQHPQLTSPDVSPIHQGSGVIRRHSTAVEPNLHSSNQYPSSHSVTYKAQDPAQHAPLDAEYQLVEQLPQQNYIPQAVTAQQMVTSTPVYFSSMGQQVHSLQHQQTMSAAPQNRHSAPVGTSTLTLSHQPLLSNSSGSSFASITPSHSQGHLNNIGVTQSGQAMNLNYYPGNVTEVTSVPMASHAVPITTTSQMTRVPLGMTYEACGQYPLPQTSIPSQSMTTQFPSSNTATSLQSATPAVAPLPLTMPASEVHPMSPPAYNNHNHERMAPSVSPVTKSPTEKNRHHSWGQVDMLERLKKTNQRCQRGERSKTCPVHQVGHDVQEEIEKLTTKNASLPMLSALANDTNLCRCLEHPASTESSKTSTLRTSMDGLPSSGEISNIPGSERRPVSLPHLLDENTMHKFDTLRINTHLEHQEPAYQNLPTNGYSVALTNYNAQQKIMMMTNPTQMNGCLIPPRLTSGGHSPNSSVLQQQIGALGIA